MQANDGTGVAGCGRWSNVFVHAEAVLLEDDGDGDGDAVLLLDNEVGEGETTTVDIATVVDDATTELDELSVGEEDNGDGELEVVKGELVWNNVSDPDGG
jgi:hypothetical protein